jgi:hypothetical protein
MAVSRIVLVGDAQYRPQAGESIGIPLEIASDGRLCTRFPQALPLAELIGDFEHTKIKAHALARRLLENEPTLREVRQLGVFEEMIIRELVRSYHALHLHQRLLAEGIGECVFAEPSNLSVPLAHLSRALGSDLQVCGAGGTCRSAAPSLARSFRRLGASGLTPSALRSEFHQLLDSIDPFHRRHAIYRRSRDWQRHAPWFFTTAHTFTNIGLAYEPYFPQPLQFLVENPLTGGRPLRARRRPFVPFYDFADGDFVPPTGELEAARRTIVEHLTNVPLDGEEKALRDLFLQSGFFQLFLARRLPYGLFAVRVIERWLDETEPSALVVGNPVFEGPALTVARRREIPTVVLQHGILGDFCQFVDPPADRYIVRGVFWRDFLAPPVRRRALVLNPREQIASAGEALARRRTIVFFTAPYALQEFWGETDLDDILRALAAAAAAEGAPLVIRVHPLERVAEYRMRLKRLLGKAPANISFSQGTPLQSILSHAAVAVTYASTAFLDCLKQNVPIVSFGWHHFSYRRQIEAYGVFHFAQNLARLRELLTEALHDSLPCYVGTIEPFLANTEEAELKRGIVSMLGRQHCRPTDVSASLAAIAAAT